MRIKPGGVRAGLDFQQSYIRHLGEGLGATDGVQYTAVVTFGTTVTEVLNELIDPGFSLQLKEIQYGLTQQFEGLNGSFVGSTIYYWEAREEYTDIAGKVGTLRASAYVPLVATYAKGVGTLTTSEDTLSGYMPVASLPHAPVRVRLMAVGLRASVVTGRVKNSSFIQLIGNVIPGA
ncbi:hypothetical protein LCGC14_2789340 [marine sediment metagenome]|uniref:Uncharacterized protein n=1 Tax=marine sediment metagenome TaxID=412755 RepID=A0A0F9BHB6_9ZZZZ